MERDWSSVAAWENEPGLESSEGVGDSHVLRTGTGRTPIAVGSATRPVLPAADACKVSS